MTEPPDGEDEFSPDEQAELDELQEFLDSEFFAEMGDDMLLDEISRGEDHRTIYDGIPEDEDELQDHLHDIREQTLDEPIPELVSVDEAKRIIDEARKKREAEQAAAQERTQSRGENTMPISDDAQAVANIGTGGEEVAAMVSGAGGAVTDAVQLLQQAGEHLSTIGQNLQAAQERVAADAAQAGNLLGGEGGSAIQGQGQQTSQAISDGLSQLATADTQAVINTLQSVDLGALTGQVQAVYQAIKDAASRHQG